MNKDDEISVRVADLNEIRRVLAACLNYFQAYDLMESQRELSSYMPSPIVIDIDRVKNRLDGYISDYLLAQYEGQDEEQDAKLNAEDADAKHTE
ncbi:MAG: hypothetical protein QXU32_02340 [Nitrososphaerales archaeon]